MLPTTCVFTNCLFFVCLSQQFSLQRDMMTLPQLWINWLPLALIIIQSSNSNVSYVPVTFCCLSLPLDIRLLLMICIQRITNTNLLGTKWTQASLQVRNDGLARDIQCVTKKIPEFFFAILLAIIRNFEVKFYMFITVYNN